MPMIDPENRMVKELTGVHLFHSAYSNCSQRVRLVLEEKEIPWVSHPINLMAFDHLTDEYQSIHPKGVVPLLVHDGAVIIESHDIIKYLDDHFDSEPLMPRTEEQRERVRPWMERGSALQTSMKTLTYERVFRAKYPPSTEKYSYYAAHQRNPELVEFYRKYVTGFTPEELARHEAATDQYLDELDAALGSAPYLVGDTISLADFSAIVNVHRAQVLGFDLARRGNLQRWYERMKARPSFDRAIIAFVSRERN